MADQGDRYRWAHSAATCVNKSAVYGRTIKAVRWRSSSSISARCAAGCGRSTAYALFL